MSTGKYGKSPDLRAGANLIYGLFSLFSSIVRYTIASPPTEFRKLITMLHNGIQGEMNPEIARQNATITSMFELPFLLL